MGKSEFYGVIAVLILSSALIIMWLTTPTRIPLITKTLITQKSEIRGVFIHESVYGYSHDWNIIAQTLASYNINEVFVNDQSGGGRRPDSEIREAIGAFHAYGIEYHSSINVLMEWRYSGTEAIKPDGSIYWQYAHCPIKAHDLILSNIEDYLETFPDVDGIMLDYIRYDIADTCYCSHCRAAFQEWLGEGPITNWAQFYPDGARWVEYAEWRTIPVTQLVKDVHDLVKSINPNIVISEAAWTLFSDSAIYWRSGKR